MGSYAYYQPNPAGKSVGDCTVRALSIIDDLMDALQVVNRRAYDNVIRKLERI